MPSGAEDSNGVYQYGSSDTNATFHGLLNIANEILSVTVGAIKTRVTAVEGSVLVNVADLNALPSPSLTEGRIVHVDDMNCNFQAQDGVWVQINDSVFASTAARNTAYAKASAAYLVVRARTVDTSTGIIYRYSGSAWKAWESDWIAYTPTLTQMVLGTGGSATGSYRYVGGRVEVDFKLVYGSSGATYPSSTNGVSLPVTAAALAFAFTVYDGFADFYAVSGGAVARGHVAANDTSVTAFRVYSGASYTALNSTTPITFAAGSIVHGVFRYSPA